MAMNGDHNTGELLTLAASSALVEEQATLALKDGKFPDETTPVVVERQIWRAQLKSQYVEPELELDPSEGLDFLYENTGKTVLKHKKPCPVSTRLFSGGIALKSINLLSKLLSRNIGTCLIQKAR
jgi:hypothetical protein